MNWNQLQYIITTAQEKSITRAAKKLFISQPSLTLSIQNLEKELGVELFERSRGAMTLTYAGRLYYDWALNTLHSRGTEARSCCPASSRAFMNCSPIARSFWRKSPLISCGQCSRKSSST